MLIISIILHLILLILILHKSFITLKLPNLKFLNFYKKFDTKIQKTYEKLFGEARASRWIEKLLLVDKKIFVKLLKKNNLPTNIYVNF